MASVTEAAIDVIREIIILKSRKVNRKWKKSVWVKTWIQRRNILGASNTLVRELALEDPCGFLNFLRINEEMFYILLDSVKDNIQKKDTVMREALPAKVKLEITLRYLAAGESLSSLQYLYRVPKCSISHFLPEVLDAIYASLKECIQVPRTEIEWMNIANGFNSKWNYPNCVGALDGKHVVIQCPPNTTSLYYNYKGTFSIVLLALVDHNYCFTVIDVGSYGSQSDGAVFDHSNLKTALESNALHVPADCVIVGDDAFPLKTYLMTQYSRRNDMPYKEKIYNYRHCRARRIVENGFGILANRFRVFRKPICLAEETAIKVIKAACALHNWIRKTNTAIGNADLSVDTEEIHTGTVQRGSWRSHLPGNGLLNLASTRNRHYRHEAREKRNNFADYFVGDGAVAWQDGMIV